MRSKIKVTTGSLSDWLKSVGSRRESFPVLKDPVSENDINAREDLLGRLVEQSHLAAYQSLLNELHTKPVELKPELVKLVLLDFREHIICLWCEDELIATAQASLLFPGMKATVHISNVVVSTAHRSQGFGEFLMIYTRKHCRTTWGRAYGKLIYQLTSREERGTRGFYESLGYKATATVRYEK